MRTKKPALAALRVVAEHGRARKSSQVLYDGLRSFNHEMAGNFGYRRLVLTMRDAKNRIIGGLIMQSWWLESFVEILWMAKRARRQDGGTRLIAEAERRARRRGSRIMHLSTYSFQAPRFYEKLGFRRVGSMPGSPAGHRRHYYLKRLQS